MRAVIEACYFLAAILFIFGLKRMSSPVTARAGIVWAGAGMVVATLVSFLYPGMGNYLLMTTAIFIGGMLAWYSGKKVAMTDMPQMIALYNGMGGGAAAAIAAVELFGGEDHGMVFGTLAVLGGMIGAVSFSGSHGQFHSSTLPLRTGGHRPAGGIQLSRLDPPRHPPGAV